jgi:hypothetical protein
MTFPFGRPKVLHHYFGMFEYSSETVKYSEVPFGIPKVN